MPSQVFNRHYWSARELVVLGVFAAAAKLSTLLVALVGGGMNPVSLLAKNLIFTTLLVVMLYKVRKPGTLALFVLVNMLISMLLLGAGVTLLPAMLLAAGCAEAAMACSGGMRKPWAPCSASRCTISRRKFFRWAFRGCSCARVRPCCMSSFPLWSSATWDRCVGFSPASAPFGSCVMQALSVTEGSGCGGGLHAADTRAKMFVSLLASVATVALSGVEPQMVLFGMSLVYALGMRQFHILLIGYAGPCGHVAAGHGVRVRDEPADPVHARVFGGVAGGAVPAHGDDAERDPAAGLFLPGAEPADRPEEFAPAVLPVSSGCGDDPFHPHVFA